MTDRIPRWDVIIVGARVAGAATAMLMARQGLRVLCLDRGHYGLDTMSTHALMRGGVVQLHRWGLLDAVAAAGTPVVRRTVLHYRGESVAVSIRPSAGVDALYAPRRTVLDPLLVDAAGRAGSTFEFGWNVKALHFDGDGRVAGVVAENRKTGARRIERAPLVVGADGRDSVVARTTEGLVISGQHASGFLYGYWADLPSDGFEWFYDAGVTAGIIPTNGGLACVFVGARASQLRTMVRAGGASSAFETLAAAAGISERLGAAEPAEAIRYAGNLPPAHLRQAYGPGWALVGDAGHWLDPLSTHGMTSALRDAELLSRAVLATPGPERSAALHEYQANRDRLSRPMIAISDEIASYSWDLTRIRELVRTLSALMADEVEALTALSPAA